jgi:multiple sugar transport system permease protein
MIGQSSFRRWMWVLFFLMPGLLGLLTFIIGPVIFSLGLTTFEWNLLTPPQFIGFQNFVDLGNDPRFWAALQHTLTYAVLYVPAVFVVAFALALLLNRPLRGRAFFRMAFYVPVVSSWVAVSMMWRWIFNPQYGLLNTLLATVGIQGPAWLFDPNTALYAVVIASVWKDAGFSTVLFLAGFAGHPHRIPRSGPDRRGERLAAPALHHPALVTPTAFFVLITTLIGSFQVFDQMYLMQVDYAQRGTTVIVQHIVNNAFRYQRMGYAATISWVLFAIIFVITLIQLRLQNRWVYYEQ